MKFKKMLYCAQSTKRTQEPTVNAVVIAPPAMYLILLKATIVIVRKQKLVLKTKVEMIGKVQS